MLRCKRSPHNPILQPDLDTPWEEQAAFNGCPIKVGTTYHLLYRALSYRKQHEGQDMELSTIGEATGTNGYEFTNHRQIIKPEYDWEKFGCEDPRVTFFEGKYYIFYTALSTYPFSPAGIQIAVAITSDFQTFEKHHVTPFNSKAMAMFPERINGKVAVILTVNTDIPPAEIAIAFLDSPEDLWSYQFWDRWYGKLQFNTLPLLRSLADHIEVGAPPIKIKEGWLFLYSYIREYQTNNKKFDIEAILLDKKDPMKILGRTKETLLKAEMPYEKYGVIPNITFPSGALLKGDTLSLYYGAADTVCGVATCSLKELVKELRQG